MISPFEFFRRGRRIEWNGMELKCMEWNGVRTRLIDGSIDTCKVPINLPDRVFSSINPWCKRVFSSINPCRGKKKGVRLHPSARARKRGHCARGADVTFRSDFTHSRRRDERYAAGGLRTNDSTIERGCLLARSFETGSTRESARQSRVRDRERHIHSPGFDCTHRNSFDWD